MMRAGLGRSDGDVLREHPLPDLIHVFRFVLCCFIFKVEVQSICLFSSVIFF